MAKTKQTPSAAQRREQQRQQRQQRLTGSQSRQPQARSRGRAQPKAQRNPLLLIGGVLLVLAAIVGIFFIVANRQSQSQSSGSHPADTSVLAKVTHVDPTLLATIGTGNLQNPLHSVNGSPPLLKGSSGKPEFFYGGGEYCPYCASERWAMIVALSRFGTFGHLNEITSSEDNISTFTFYHSTYTSSYIDFVPVELAGNDANHSDLQTPTAEQNQLITTYDAAPYTDQPGSIPFIDIANRYIQVGLAQGANGQNGFSFQDIQNMQWSDIANALSDTSSPVAQHILGSANYLTAGICMTTNQQPGSVCNTSAIQTIERSLRKTAMGSSGIQIGAVMGQADAVVRRND